MSKLIKLDSEKIAALCAKEAEEKKAEDIKALKVSDLTTVADYFVLCSAKSEVQLKALGDWLEKRVREELDVRPISREGTPASRWMLLDFGPVLVHLMTEDMREKYQLESLWGDAPQIEAVRKLEEMSASK
jgi:ribosome-associated protein